MSASLASDPWISSVLIIPPERSSSRDCLHADKFVGRG